MFLFIWVNCLNVGWMDFVFLEPSVFLYIAYFVELSFLAIFFAFGGNFAGLSGGFFWPFGKMPYFSEDENFFIKSFLSWVEMKAWYCSVTGIVTANK